MSKAKEVIVVGGGLAGLCATLEAVALGAKVTLLEKTKGIGGNSAKATSGINGTPTAYQASAGIEDGIEHFQKDTISSGDGLSDPRLVEVLVNSSKEAIEYLSSFGLNLSAISQCGGHSRPRTHREPDAPDGKPAPVGWDIIKTLGARVKEHQAVTLLTEARATRFLTSDGAVVGLEYEKEGERKELRADAVVMCTGGFCCDRTEDSLLVEFAPQKSRMPTTNGPFAIGDGIRMGRAVGAQLIHMDKVQLHPTGFVDPNDPKNPVKFLGPEALRGSGGILLNPKGERFVNELGRRDHVTQKILEQFPGPEVEGGPLNPDAHATILLNDQAVALFGKHAWEFYFRVKKFGTTVSGAKGLAEHLKVPEQVVLQTLEDYNAAAASQKQDPFGKKTFPVTFKPDENFYLCTITPVLHYSMGGLRITQEAEVLGEGDKVIKGLYGAGEVTGGVHGENRLAGNSLLECVVFGRIAGRSAAKL